MESKESKDKSKEIETPAEAPMSMEEQASLKKNAEALMTQHDVEEVFYVGGYWFTQKSYADEYGKKVNEKIKTFTK